MPFQIFEGVFDSFAETGGSLDFFGQKFYLDKSAERLAATAAASGIDDLFLPSIVAGMLLERGSLSVLDYGGGPGLSYVPLKRALGSAQGLTWHVYDNPGACALGRSRLHGDSGLAFFERADDLQPRYDAVHFGGMLQYVEDIDGLLKETAERQPDTMLVSFGMTGTDRSFVTLADYYGHKHPHRFFSLPDFDALFGTVGYRRAVTIPYVPTIRGQAKFYDMRNLPEGCRTEFAHHLAYVRRSKR